MKLLAIVAMLSSYALAQTVSPDAACGPADARFKVTRTKTQHPMPTAPDGQAMLYVLGFAGAPIAAGTAALGLDGIWIGAVSMAHGYFAVPITAGEHHLCARWSTRTGLWGLPMFKIGDVALHSLDAKPGATYYVGLNVGSYAPFSFALLDPDEGRHRLAASTFNVSQPK
jgi:hypothetical protein